MKIHSVRVSQHFDVLDTDFIILIKLIFIIQLVRFVLLDYSSQIIANFNKLKFLGVISIRKSALENTH